MTNPIPPTTDLAARFEAKREECDWAAILAQSILEPHGVGLEMHDAVATELRRIEATGYTRGYEACHKAAAPAARDMARAIAPASQAAPVAGVEGHAHFPSPERGRQIAADVARAIRDALTIPEGSDRAHYAELDIGLCDEMEEATDKAVDAVMAVLAEAFVGPAYFAEARDMARAGDAGGAEDLIRRSDVLAICQDIADTAIGYIFAGNEPDHNRRREAMEATATSIRHAVANLPAAGEAGDHDWYRMAVQIRKGIVGGNATGTTAEMLRAIADNDKVVFPIAGGMEPRHLRERASYLEMAETTTVHLGEELEQHVSDKHVIQAAGGADGFVLMPRELTPEMEEAACCAADSGSFSGEYLSRIYRALVAAAPPPPAQQGSAVESGLLSDLEDAAAVLRSNDAPVCADAVDQARNIIANSGSTQQGSSSPLSQGETVDLADRPLAEQAKHHGRDWAVWWQGSGERGDHIMELTQTGLGYARELAWIGDQHHEQADAIVAEHNEQVRRLREVIARQAAAKGLLQAELGRIKAIIPASLTYEVPDAAEAIASTFQEYVKVAAEATALRKALATARDALVASITVREDDSTCCRLSFGRGVKFDRERAAVETAIAALRAELVEGQRCPASLATARDVGTGAGDLVAYLHRNWAWSKETFGPALRTKGIVQHITKELREIEAEPHDLAEWVDVIILAMDGFWRHGGKPEDLLPAMQAKQDRNFARTWPDWRTMGEDQAIEHDRSGEAPTLDPRKEALAVLDPFDDPPRWANFYRTMERLEKSDRNKAVWAGLAAAIEAALAPLSATDQDGEARGDA